MRSVLLKSGGDSKASLSKLLRIFILGIGTPHEMAKAQGFVILKTVVYVIIINL